MESLIEIHLIGYILHIIGECEDFFIYIVQFKWFLRQFFLDFGSLSWS